MNPSRERFEQEQAFGYRSPAELAEIQAKGVGYVDIASEQRKFFNTTSETGQQLAEYQQKAGEQNAEVLAIFQRLRKPLSPSQVLAYYPHAPGALLPPLTSIRRAITTLTQAGALVKTEEKRRGVYGRSEFVWRLLEGGQHG